MTQALISFIAFQLCWFACVGGAARGVPWLGPVVVAAYAAAWLRTIPPRSERTRQLRFIGLAGTIGYAADSALVLSGVLAFPPHAVLGWPSTAWMVALWVLQAATLRGVMSWLEGRFAWSAVVGAIGGPLAYLAGERMGAAVLGPSRSAALAAIAVEWALAMPCLVWLESRARAGSRAEERVDGASFAP
jgi:hypothetical protein